MQLTLHHTITDFHKQHFVVMLSGGLDSSALLHLFKSQYPDVALAVIHFNYQLRGSESTRDENFVKELCASYSLPLTIVQARLGSSSSIQNAAREYRYSKVSELASQMGWTHCLTAHHADDQLETLIMKMDRGCGIRGLQGIHQELHNSQITFVRPLLQFFKDEIAQYAHYQRLKYVEDSSNASDKYLRNRIRHHDIPELKGKLSRNEQSCIINQSLKLQTYLKQASLESKRLFEMSNRTYYHEVLTEEIFGLKEAERFIFLESVLNHYGYTKELGTSVYDRFMRNISTSFDKTQSLGPVSIYFLNKTIVFGCFDKTWDKIEIPAPDLYDWGSIKIKISLRNRNNADLSSPEILYLSASSLRWPLTMRAYRPGERFRPYGRCGSKKIADFFYEMQIPKFKRHYQPVLEDSLGVIALPGLALDRRCAINQDTTEVLAIELI